MPIGEGKYDDLCTHVREQAQATGAVVIVLGGPKGSGFSVQGPIDVQLALPAMLEQLARQIRTAIHQDEL